jgi:magnesium transporter
MPVMPILQRLTSAKYWTLTEEEQDSLEDVVLDVDQSIQICANNANRVVSIREAYAILSSNSLNMTMKALTTITLLITIPNVIFGLYGMNVGLPFGNQAWAFAAIIGGTILLIILTFILARRKGWL